MKTIVYDQNKSDWLNGIKNKSKLDFLSDIKPEMGVEPLLRLT